MLTSHYVKKNDAFEVDAVKVTEENAEEIATWANGRVDNDSVAIKTSVGYKYAAYGQYLVKFKNDIFVADASDFEARYRVVEDSNEEPLEQSEDKDEEPLGQSEDVSVDTSEPARVGYMPTEQDDDDSVDTSEPADADYALSEE